MRRVMLLHPLAVSGLVGRYPTNNLIALSPIPKRRNFARQTMRSDGVIEYYPQFPGAILDFGAR